MAESEQGLRAHPLPAAVGLGPRAEGDAALLPARALPRVAGRDPRRRSRRSRSRPTSSSGSPARPRRTSPTRSTSCRARAVRLARTRSSTRRGRGRGRRRCDDQIPKEVVQERFDRLVALQERISLEKARGAGRRRASRCSSRAPGKRRSVDAGPDADEPDRAPRRGARAGHVRHRSDHGRRRAPSRRRGRAGARRWSERRSRRGAVPRAGRSDRLRQDRGCRSRSPKRSARRSSRSTRCSCTAGWTSGPRSRRPSNARACRTTCSTWSSRASRSPWRAFQAAAREATRGRPSPRRDSRCWSGVPACTSGRSWTTSSSPAPSRRRGRARGRGGGARRRADVPSGWPIWIRSPRRKIEPENVRRTVRALEVRGDHRDGRSAHFAAAWERYAAGPRACRGPPDVARRRSWRRIEARVDAMLDAGWLDEVEGLVARGFGGWLTSTQAIGYAELARHLQESSAWRTPSSRPSSGPRTLARRQMAWFRRDPRIRWFDVGRRRSRSSVGGRASSRTWRTRERASASGSTRGPATTS